MTDHKKDAPSAVAAALGANVGNPVSPRPRTDYHANQLPLKPMAVIYVWPDGRLGTVRGKNARALIGLIQKRQEGFTRSDMSGWEGYLPSHISDLRKLHRLDIQSTREPHHGGFHARYFILSPIEIREIIKG